MANNQLKEEIILSTQHFDQKIDDVIKKVNKLQSQGNKAGNGFNKSMGGMISKANGFGGSLSGVLGVATKLSGVLGGITAGVNLADWFSNSVKEGVRLAEAGEGIRLAFERLNRGNLLAKLREETHNTVSDIELMKQAVKFNDFNLDVEQMGKFLAYAQMKAKDTGESIDYMVNSITTGLGRKSLPILDNLGLSAAEIKEEMAKGGDMVTAVTKIIEKRMKEAGGYVDTAADRAERRRVELQNSLEQLGRTFQPLSEASATFWHSLEIGAINALNKLAPIINKLTEAGRILQEYQNIGGSQKVKRQVDLLKGIQSDKSRRATYNKQMANYNSRIAEDEQYLKDFKAWKGGSISALDRLNAYADKYKGGNRFHEGNFNEVKTSLAAKKREREEYMRGAKPFLTPKSSTPTGTTSATTPTTTTKFTKTKEEFEEKSIGWYQDKIAELKKNQKNAKTAKEYNDIEEQIKTLNIPINEITGGLTPTIPLKADVTGIGSQIKEMMDKAKNDPIVVPVKTSGTTKIKASLEDISSVVGELGSSLSGLGSALEAPILDVAGVMAQAVATMILGYAQATKMAGEIAGPWAWIAFGATGLAQLAAIITTIKSLGAYANGGIVGGSSYAGDRLYARVNSGEMILNGNQQQHLFNMINNGGGGVASTGEVQFVIKGSDLYGTLKNYNSKMGKVR